MLLNKSDGLILQNSLVSEKNHFKRLNEYFTKSRLGYDFLLYGAKHFGFYPKNKKISEKGAQNLMHDLIGEKL